MSDAQPADTIPLAQDEAKMKMHQPAYAHFATNYLLFSLVCFAAIYFISARQHRNVTDPAQLSKRSTERRWTYSIFWLSSGAVIASLYSIAFDLPHDASPRTLSILSSGLIGPSLPFLRMWIDKRNKERAAKGQARQEQPYYIANQQEPRNSRHT